MTTEKAYAVDRHIIRLVSCENKSDSKFGGIPYIQYFDHKIND